MKHHHHHRLSSPRRRLVRRCRRCRSRPQPTTTSAGATSPQRPRPRRRYLRMTYNITIYITTHTSPLPGADHGAVRERCSVKYVPTTTVARRGHDGLRIFPAIIALTVLGWVGSSWKGRVIIEAQYVNRVTWLHSSGPLTSRCSVQSLYLLCACVRDSSVLIFRRGDGVGCSWSVGPFCAQWSEEILPQIVPLSCLPGSAVDTAPPDNYT